MGVISTVLSLGGLLRDAKGVTEVLVENKTQASLQEHEEFQAALEQLGKEFARERLGWFDALIDGLNRLPRPAMAIGTLGLFSFAMFDPVAFSARMQGLALVPDPLWWLLGAIVSFYFGARELHHFRSNGALPSSKEVSAVIRNLRQLEELGAAESAGEASTPTSPKPISPKGDHKDANAAVAEWLALQ